MGTMTPSPAAPGRPRPGGRRWRLPAAGAALAVGLAIAVAVAATRPGQGSSTGTGPGQLLPAAGPVPVFSRYSLAPSHGALFGAWVQPTGYTGADAEQSAVAAFERKIGRKLAIDHLYIPWTAPMPVAVARWDQRHGSIPMISWAAARTDRIAAGRYDALIRARALQLKALHRPVLLRWFAEMDLPGSRADAISPASYVAAWRHMHRIFASVGATNVRWVWCPSASPFGTGVAKAYYPGKSYVDWIGADGYNWAPERPDTTWRSFEQIFAAFYTWGLPTGKPMLVGEFGSIEGAPGAKAAWFTQADRALRTLFPAVRAVVYFNSEHRNFGKYFDWRVTSSRSALAAFRAFANDSYFKARPSI
jgi:hypothetical protein